MRLYPQVYKKVTGAAAWVGRKVEFSCGPVFPPLFYWTPLSQHTERFVESHSFKINDLIQLPHL